MDLGEPAWATSVRARRKAILAEVRVPIPIVRRRGSRRRVSSATAAQVGIPRSLVMSLRWTSTFASANFLRISAGRPGGGSTILGPRLFATSTRDQASRSTIVREAVEDGLLPRVP